MSAIIKPREAAAYIGVKPATLASWRHLDRGALAYGKPTRGPRWIDVEGRCLGYRQADLDSWLDAHATKAVA